MPTLFENIIQAHQALRPKVRVTPLDHSVLLSSHTGCEVYLKCEHLQPSNKLRLLSDEQRTKGVITASTGNRCLLARKYHQHV